MILHVRAAAQAGPRFGAHMSIAGGLPHAVERAESAGCDALQIFSKSSNQWRARPLVDTAVAAFRARVEESGIGPVVAHASYLINLASPDTTLRQRSERALEDELQRADALGLEGVVLHPGAYTTSNERDGLARIAESIDRVFTRHPAGSALLLLEQTAGQGTVLGHRFEHLRSIIDDLEDTPRVAICLDTCHMVAAGYDIISAQGYDGVFEDFASTIGFDRLKLFHLNDSKKPLASRVDRHTHIGQGCIGLEPFRRLVRDDRFAGLPMVLETPKTGDLPPSSLAPDPSDLDNLATLRRLRQRLRARRC